MSRRMFFHIAAFMAISGGAFAVSDFAGEVVDWQGAFYADELYNDPAAMLGKPATRCRNDTAYDPTLPYSFRVKLAEAAYYLSLDGQRVVTRICAGEYVTVKFDHKVVDYPGNPYGCDFIVFGNSFFYDDMLDNQGKDIKISDSGNMNLWYLTKPAQIAEEESQPLVQVSQDGQSWHSFNPADPNTPRVDYLFPTQAYRWDRQSASWTDTEMDFTRPVDPNLKPGDFSGLTAAEAIDLYDGSGGGAGFDLKSLPDFNDLSVDAESGCRWIQYVRIGVPGPADTNVEIDAVSDVSACGDPTHPYPVGDITQDCRVNMDDFAVLAAHWQDSFAGADLSAPPDGYVLSDDLLIFAAHWLECTFGCGP